MANEFKVKNGLITPNAILEGSTSGSTTLQASSAASGTITLPALTGTIALTNNKLSVFAATTSAELASVISDETGTGNLVLSASPTFTGTISAANLTLSGNLTVNGTTTTINSTTVSVDDKNIILADVASPSDATSDGGGITLKGTTDKTFNWVDATDAWTSSEHLNLLTGKSYYINGVAVLNSTSLGSGITSSSLTTLGTIATGTWQASLISSTYGGTGVNNGGRTLTINSGNLTFAADAAGSSVIVPSSGTLATLAGTETLTNKTLTTPIISSISNTGTITLPTSTDTLVGRATTDILSNKTLTTPKINDTSSDHTYNFASSELSANRTITLPLLTGDDTFVFESHTQTLTNKTLTSPTVSGLYLSDSSIVFEGSSADGFETTLTVTNPTTDQIITLPNATTTLVGTNTSDTLTNKTLTSPDINAGTVDSITSFSLRDTSAAFDVTITSASSTALTAARTLTLDLVNVNRSVKLAGNLDLAANLITSGGHSVTFNTTGATSLTLPTSGTIITQDSLNTPTLTTPKINDASSDHTYNFTVNELTGNRNITLPLLTSNDTFVFEAHTQTLTNKTLTSPTVSGLYLSDSSIVFEGSSADTNETTLTVTNPTADRTITIPDASGTIALTNNKLSDFSATTSSELAGVISDETGSGSLVFATSPTFTTGIDGGATFSAFASSTSLTLGYSSTAASTTNISTGAVAAATTKTINIGTGGAASSTTNINLGSSNGGTVTVNKDLVVTGDLTVNGTTTTVNSTTITVDDKNIELGSVATPTNTTADGGGITLKGATDKTFNWVNATSAWTSSEHVALASGKNVLLNGSTSGTITLAVAAAAGTNTVTFPATTGNVVTTGDTGTVTNTMLAGSIAAGKLTLTSANIIVGNGSNVGAAVAMSGDITIDNTGATTIGSGKVTNAMLAGSIAAGKLTLTSANIIVGNGSNVGAAVAMSGDATIANTGALTIANSAVTYAKIQNVSATDKILGRSSAGAGIVEEITCTSAGRALLDDADASAQRTTLGLGSAATMTGPSGTIVGTSDNQTLTNKTLGLPKFDISAAVSAAGSTQGTATALTTMINNVTTVAASTGVVLPTAVAGYMVIVRNGGANALNVYPATGAAINAGAANAAHSLPVGAMIQYVATSTTQWYTMSSTFA